jgi:hypothetical protein
MRWIALATLAFAATHCKETAVTIGMGAVKVAEEESKHRAERSSNACGRECGENQLCNHLYSPPRCAPTRLGAGDRCGRSTDGLVYNCETGYTCEGPPNESKCVATGDAGPCAVVSNNIDAPCPKDFACFIDNRCRPACPGCNQPFQHCNLLYDPPRCLPNLMPDGTKCGHYSGAKVFNECAGVCSGKPGEQVCVARVGDGSCHYRQCPSGTHCDRDETCVPNGAK